jgi:hypothetical protein
MEQPARQEFRHRDHGGDRFELYGNQAFSVIRFWGVAMFALGMAAIPVALLFALLSRPLEAVLGAGATDAFGSWLAAAWMFLSIPIAIYFAHRRWRQVQRNYMIVASGGFELLRYPRAPMRVPWTQVRRVHDPTDYEDDDYSLDPLRFETEQGNFKLSGDHWPIGEIRAAVAKHVPVTYRKDGPPR